MTPESLLRILRDFEVSVTLSPESDKLILDGRDEVIKQHLPAIREQKNAIIEILKKPEGTTLHHDGKAIILIRDENGLFDLEQYVYENAVKRVFIDSETTGLDPFSAELVLVQLLAGNQIFLIDVGAIPADHRKAFFYDGMERILEDESILKVFHNGLFDMKFLKYRLFDNNGIRFVHLFDTMLAEQLLTAGVSQRGDHSLKALCRKYLKIELDKGLQTSFVPGQPFTAEQIRYASDDVKHLEAIFTIQAGAIAKAGLTDIALLEFGIIPAVVNIELAGVHLDIGKLEKMKAGLLKDESRIEKELNDIIKAAGHIKQSEMFDGSAINFKSPVQVQQLLSDFGFDVSGTGIEIIEKINHPFAAALVEYRKVSKLLSSFGDKLPKHIHEKTGRIHPEFFQLGTEAGRFTCQNPNLQQIPHDQEWRNLFSAPAGRRIITADYSQIELRILAEFSQDPAFLDAYRNGQDLHSRTASEMFNVPIDQINKDQRGIAKTINFGLCYGMSAKGLSDKLNITSEKAESFINQYFRAYPKVKNTLQALGMKAANDLCSITLGGRKRYYPATDSFSSQKSLERKGRNTPIQGTCGDILKKAILYLSASLREYDAAIVNLIHDEIMIEVREDQADAVRDIARRDMIQAGQDYIKSVPVEVDIKIDSVWRK
jgi:DNA polymerase-1